MTTIIHNYAANSDSSPDEEVEETFVRFSITKDPDPDINIDSNYFRDNSPQHLYAFLKSICGHEAFTELVERFFNEIDETDNDKAMEFMKLCVEGYKASDFIDGPRDTPPDIEPEPEPEESNRQIIWDFIDQEELIARHMKIMEEQMKEDGEDEVRIIKPILESDEQMVYWIGNTNFDLHVFGRIIAKCTGVDNFIQISRYRFSFVVGELFNITDIRKELIEKLGLKNSEKTV